LMQVEAERPVDDPMEGLKKIGECVLPALR
jgi:hypothetical protein